MLTDDQLDRLRHRYLHVGHGDEDGMLQAAYRLGMLRAAEVCKERTARDGITDDAPLLNAITAIRAEAER